MIKKIILIFFVLLIILQICFVFWPAKASAANEVYIYTPNATYINYAIGRNKQKTGNYIYFLIWYPGNRVLRDETRRDKSGDYTYYREMKLDDNSNIIYVLGNTLEEIYGYLQSPMNGYDEYDDPEIWYNTSKYLSLMSRESMPNPYIKNNKVCYYGSNSSTTRVIGSTSSPINKFDQNEVLRVQNEYYPSGYTLSFDSQGGNSINSIEETTSFHLVDNNGEYLPQYIPKKGLKKFEGWFYDLAYTEKATDLFIMSEDITLYAKWGKTYLYSPAPEFKYYTIMEFRDAPNLIIEKRYKIVWYKEGYISDYTQKVDGYYKRYLSHYNGEEIYISLEAYETLQEALEAISTPRKILPPPTYFETKYQLYIGWQRKFYDSIVEFDVPYVYNNRKMYYALNKTEDLVKGTFEIDENQIDRGNEVIVYPDEIESYDLIFDENGAEDMPDLKLSAVNLYDYNKGQYFEEFKPYKYGSVFLGWYGDNDVEIRELFMLTENTTLKAKYRDARIYFDSLGGSEIDDIAFVDGLSLYFPNTINYDSLFIPTKSKYLFDGWYAEKDLIWRIGDVWNASALGRVENDIILYAKYGKIAYIDLNKKNKLYAYYAVHDLDISTLNYDIGNENIVRIVENTSTDPRFDGKLMFYAINLGQVEVSVRDHKGNLYKIVVSVFDDGETIFVNKTFHEGDVLKFEEYLNIIDFSSMVYLGGDESYIYVASPGAGAPVEETEPEENYLWFYPMKRGYCIIAFNCFGENPPIQFFFTVLAVGETSLGGEETPMPKVQEMDENIKRMQNEIRNHEQISFSNFIDLDNVYIPNDVDLYLQDFAYYMAPLYYNEFVVAAITIVGIIVFAGYLLSAKIRG